MSTFEDFKEITTVSVESGNSVSLRFDCWSDQSMEFKYPHLYPFAKNDNISMQRAIQISSANIYELFHLPLSIIAHEELHQLRMELELTDTSQEPDHWTLQDGSASYITRKCTSH